MNEPVSIETSLEVSDINERVGLVVHILASSGGQEYFAYEQDQCWFLGLGCQSSLLIDSAGKSAIIKNGDAEQRVPIQSTLDQATRDFVAGHTNSKFKIFGHVGYNYAAHVRGIGYTAGQWPLLYLMVPRYQIMVASDKITIQGKDDEGLHNLVDAIKSAGSHAMQPPQIISADLSQTASHYTKAVERTLSKINDGEVTKAIISRAVSLPDRIDMLATLLEGRRVNTPKRTFTFSLAGYQSTGFSPELILSLRDGKVTTEPLAGTRACPENQSERQRLKNELESDPKEIVEHVISVKEAISELEQICSTASVAVEDLMSVRTRGRVQHLGSRVTGILKREKDCWDALNVLFPSITASGIPKQAALEVIESLEPCPRELYSGGIIMMDPSGKDFEATLVLRSAFQDGQRRWAQAGAGVIAQSRPERELTETCEKLATLIPFLVAEKK